MWVHLPEVSPQFLCFVHPKKSLLPLHKKLEKKRKKKREEERISNALLLQAAVSSQERKLSLPRSALLKNSTLGKRPSAIIKAGSPLRNISLKRQIESPERPNIMRSGSFEWPSPLVFNTAIRGSPERLTVMRYESFEWPSQPVINSTIHGSPDRPNATKYGSPETESLIEHESRPISTAIYGSPERSAYNLSISELRRPKKLSSLFSRAMFQQPKVVHDLYDEDGEEKDLELFVSIMTSTRRKLQTNVSRISFWYCIF